MTCQQIESLLPSIVDGAASPEEARRAEAHLAGCAACREAAAEQRLARTVLRARAAHVMATAPPGLATRLEALGRAETAPVMGWRGRASALAAAALVVGLVGVAVMPVVTVRWPVVLAAQLALDHLKCFVIDGGGGAETISAPVAAARLRETYGYTFPVPDLSSVAGVRLVAIRRCLYGDGLAAHLLYRVDGAPVSLFVMPGLEEPAAELNVLGQDQVVWHADGRTYMLVGGAAQAAPLARMASYLKNEAQ